MAYDTTLASRVRDVLGEHLEIAEREMFGGIAFLLSGNMAVGVSKDDLMVRIDPDEHDEALAAPGVRAFDMTGRPMRGWILVAPEATAEVSDLQRWVEIGLAFAGTLPAK
jgi:TfoX/Sxy family transcriptional regulator of competence genes